MPRFHVSELAEADLDEAFVWYEAQREALGHAFLDAVEATFARMRREPQQFPVVERGVRRALVRRFPYAVYYLATPDRIDVLACVHVRRHPRRWQSRR
jgi:plasmid stabilization system protein ParE